MIEPATNPTPPEALNKLHDFYQPPPPAWTPQTIGWYILFALAIITILWLMIRAVRRWAANRYRRESLRELVTLPMDQLSTLLKRTALVAWPRKQIASLNGPAWLQFLDASAGIDSFQRSPGDSIEDLALQPTVLSDADEQELRQLAAEWIRRHRV